MEPKHLFTKALPLVLDVFLVSDVFLSLTLTFLFWSTFTFSSSTTGTSGSALTRDGCLPMLRDETSRSGLPIRAAAWGDDLSSSLISSSSLFRMVCPCPWTLMDPTPSLVIRFPLECFSHSHATFPLGKWHLMKRKTHRFKWTVCYFTH